MKISTKGRYALRLMLDLAVYNNGTPISLKEISKRQNISDKYLEQIISVLNKAGYVNSIRGAQGGYSLARKPIEYKVGDILRLTEGDLSPVGCVGPNANDCDRRDMCVTVLLYEKIDDAIRSVVDTITLEDLLNWYNEKGADYII